VSLKQKAVSGVKWSGFSMGAVTALQFITVAVLARLLSPSDFGLMGMIMVVVGFAQAFADMGLSNAVIYRQDVTDKHLFSFFWLNICIGIIIFLFILTLRPIISGYFQEELLNDYLIYSAFIFLITPLGQIFTTLLRKELRFKILSKIEIFSTLVYSVTAIILAALGYGVLSLVFGQLVRSIFQVVFLFFVFKNEWLPRFYFNLHEIKSYLAFGGFQMGERAVNYLSANIDYIIIGRFLGPVALGYYTLAYNIMIFPLTKINPIITRVAFPAFSKVQSDNAKIQKGYCKILKYISTITFPMIIGMMLVASEFIPLVYGEKWTPTISILQIFCIVGIFKSLGNPMGAVLLSKGRADIGFYWNIFVVFCVCIAVLIGVQWGVVGVAWAILFLQIPFFSIIQPVVNRIISMNFKQYFNSLKTSFFCSLLMSFSVLMTKIIFENFSMPIVFMLSILVGSFSYIISYYLIEKSFFIEIKSLLVGR
jgi:O-antigen/teichoic acid export membrane protein